LTQTTPKNHQGSCTRASTHAWTVPARRWPAAALGFQKWEGQSRDVGDWAVWSVVEQSSKQSGIEHFGAHDLRRSCAKLCRKNGGDLEQIKFLLGHSSIQTTEWYLGLEQTSRLR
jgi:integrase